MEFVIIFLLILLNGILSMSEIALVSSRKSRLQIEAKKGSVSASRALKLSNQPDKFLSTIQIGITLIGILTGLFSGQAFAEKFEVIFTRASWLEPYAHIIARILIVFIVTYFTLVFGELVPKRIGMGHAEKIAMLMARPMNILSRMASPFVWLLSRSTRLILKILGIKQSENKVTEEEIKAVIKEGLNDGEIQEVEQALAERVFNLGDRNISSLMTHRSELVWLDINDSTHSIRKKVKEHLFNVYPVADGQLDNIAGTVAVKDLFAQINTQGFSLKHVLHPAQYMPANQSVYKTLEQFKGAQVRTGLVIDEFGTLQGIVTLKDIMEGLIGQVTEWGEEKEIVQRPDGSWLIDGQISFYNFLEFFDMDEFYTDYEYNTLSGLLLELFQHIPHTGESIEWMGFDMEIVDMDGARIDKVLVKR